MKPSTARNKAGCMTHNIHFLHRTLTNCKYSIKVPTKSDWHSTDQFIEFVFIIVFFNNCWHGQKRTSVHGTPALCHRSLMCDAIYVMSDGRYP